MRRSRRERHLQTGERLLRRSQDALPIEPHRSAGYSSQNHGERDDDEGRSSEHEEYFKVGHAGRLKEKIMFEAQILVIDAAGAKVRIANKTGESPEAALQATERWVVENLRETALDWDHVEVTIRRCVDFIEDGRAPTPEIDFIEG
jgi:hypothetical protein